MIYRKGELSPASIDRGWPHQVALPASACEQRGYRAIHELSICSRGHSAFHEDKWFNVYCLPTPGAPLTKSIPPTRALIYRRKKFGLRKQFLAAASVN